MIKKNIIIFLLLLYSCGYQPIFVDKNSNKLIFKEIELTGEKDINRKIISISGFKEDSQNFTYSKLKINSKKRVAETSKNAKGQVSSFKTTIEIDLIIEDKNNGITSKSFNESFSYNNIENKFELSEYQNEVETILVNNIFEELIIYFNL